MELHQKPRKKKKSKGSSGLMSDGDNNCSSSQAKSPPISSIPSPAPAGILANKSSGSNGKSRGRKSKGNSASADRLRSVNIGDNRIIIKKEKEALPSVPAPRPGPLDTKLRPSGRTADWDEFLSTAGYNLHFIPPVTYFKHAPLVKAWNELAIVGLKIEIPNTFVRCSRPVNWIATIRHFAGYKALVEYECFGELPRHAAWMSFCSDVPKHIGYSDKERILLHPPHSVRHCYPNFIEKGREAVRNCKTVSEAHGALIQHHIKKSQKYPLLTMLEVMDRDNAERMRVATVTGIIGTRIHVTYVSEPKKGDFGYWFDVNSDSVHPIGWSQTVGHEIYDDPSSGNKFTPLSPEHFPSYPDELVLAEGQMLEARHPYRLHQICAAKVLQVLNYGYFVAVFRTTGKERKELLVFTFHVTSPYIFPCGFCEKNSIPLVPPFGESKESFSWEEYLEKNRVQPALLHLIPERKPHKFKVGMKMEACGIIEPTYLGPATIRKVHKHLLYLTFDGWPRGVLNEPEVDTEFWIDAESPEIYPIGFAEMVGHNFQGRVVSDALKK